MKHAAGQLLPQEGRGGTSGSNKTPGKGAKPLARAFVGEVTSAQVQGRIAEAKMKDLRRQRILKRAMLRMIEGSARAMGLWKW